MKNILAGLLFALSFGYAQAQSPVSPYRCPAEFNCVNTNYLYVSNVVANGQPVGSDSNAGTFAAPYLTLDTALTAAVQASTQYDTYTIVLNGDPANRPIYLATVGNGFAPARGVQIDAMVPFGAAIAPKGAVTSVVALSNLIGETFRFGRIYIDRAGVATNCIGIPNGTGIQNVLLAGTKCGDWSGTLNTTTNLSNSVGIASTGNGTNVNLTLINADIRASATLISLTSFKSGTVKIISSDLAQPALGANAGASGIKVSAISTSSATSFIMQGSKCTIGVNPATTVGTASLVPCVWVENIPGAVIVNNDISVAGASAALLQGAPIVIDSTDSANALYSGGFYVGNNRLYTDTTGGGYVIKIGQEGTGLGDNLTSDGIVEGNAISCSQIAAAADAHGIFDGFTSRNIVRRNRVKNCGTGLAIKDTIDGVYESNYLRSTGIGSASLLFKGTTRSIGRHNTIVNDSWVTASTPMIYLEQDATSTTNTTAATVEGNIVYGNGLASTKFFQADNNQTITSMRYNDYYAGAGGTLSSSAFSYHGSTYATVALWNAAGVETTGLALDPKFRSLGADDIRLLNTSTLIAALPVDLGTAMDLAGRQYFTPGTPGAMQFYAQ